MYAQTTPQHHRHHPRSGSPALRAQRNRGAPAALPSIAPVPFAMPTIQRTPGAGSAAAAAREDVWGFQVTRSMCRCAAAVRNGIDWANEAGGVYQGCDVPANASGTDVEHCFDAAEPGTVVAGSTSQDGTVTTAPTSTDACDRIDHHATLVHEHFHARHADDIARGQGTAFWAEWRRLAGTPNRLDVIAGSFPAEAKAFRAQWDNGHDWASDEVNSYRWERRFLVDVRDALGRICAS